MNGTEIVRRVDLKKAARSLVEQMWNYVEQYIAPLRMGNQFIRPQTEGSIQWMRDDVNDSTGIMASQRFAAAMHGTITNSAFKWWDRVFRDRTMSNQSQTWLQNSVERSYDELNQSNFDAEVSSAYQDLVNIGNTLMSAESENEEADAWEGVNFTTFYPREIFFDFDHRGNLLNVYRWLEWTALKIKSKWPEEKLPKDVEACLAEGGDIQKKFDVIFCIYFRPEKKSNVGSLSPLAPKERPYGFKYIFKTTKEEIGKEGGYYEMPAFLGQWEKTSGSDWGHGPGIIMCPTVMYINAWMELEDLALRKMVDPASLVTERGLMSDLDLKPGGTTVVRDLERSIKVFQTEGRIDLSHMKLEDLRKMVRDAFHLDEFQLRDSPQMSATEAQIRYELMNRVLGPTMGRIQTGLLTPMLERVWRMLLRNKQFGDIPEEVRAKKAQYRTVYRGPLVRAQKADEVAAIERFVGQIAAMAKAWPAVLLTLDPVNIANELATRMGVPATMLKDRAEVKAQLDMIQKMQAMQAKSQLQQAQGEADQAQQPAAKPAPMME